MSALPSLAAPPVAWLDSEERLRVVLTPEGPVCELPDGKDEQGQPRWICAVVWPDRVSGEPWLEGWEAIARSAGYSKPSVRRWGRLPTAPLPVEMGANGKYRIRRTALEVWLRERERIR